MADKEKGDGKVSFREALKEDKNYKQLFIIEALGSIYWLAGAAVNALSDIEYSYFMNLVGSVVSITTIVIIVRLFFYERKKNYRHNILSTIMFLLLLFALLAIVLNI